ncbi:MAG TPA: Ig-like domain-containing protein [Chitinophagaceae bacterium]
MKCTSLLLSMVAGLLIITGCSKDDDDDHEYNSDDMVAPTIEITGPTANQVFNDGTMINVTGNVTDDKGLYRGSIRLTNDANGSLLKEQLYEIHGFLAHSFTFPYLVDVTSSADYTITVQFEDHGNNSTTKAVKVKAIP